VTTKHLGSMWRNMAVAAGAIVAGVAAAMAGR
jgi:hypothetical protein